MSFSKMDCKILRLIANLRDFIINKIIVNPRIMLLPGTLIETRVTSFFGIENIFLKFLPVNGKILKVDRKILQIIAFAKKNQTIFCRYVEIAIKYVYICNLK